MPSTLSAPETRRMLHELRGDHHWRRAWHGYRDCVLDLAATRPQPRLLEVGGGRSPLLTAEDVERLGADYTVNDIDAGELARAPAWVDTLHGDIADPALGAGGSEGSFDLVFAKLVFEHVADPANAYRTIARLLRPGGVFVNLIPTLYAPPFVVNRLLTEGVSARVLRWAMPNRNDEEVPKFPAYYRWCTSTPRTERKLREVGFDSCVVMPFYGHAYYRKIPVLRTAGERVSATAARRDWRPLSTFALVLCER
jgi:SAM-dependent methyltransferase